MATLLKEVKIRIDPDLKKQRMQKVAGEMSASLAKSLTTAIAPLYKRHLIDDKQIAKVDAVVVKLGKIGSQINNVTGKIGKVGGSIGNGIDKGMRFASHAGNVIGMLMEAIGKMEQLANQSNSDILGTKEQAETLGSTAGTSLVIQKSLAGAGVNTDVFNKGANKLAQLGEDKLVSQTGNSQDDMLGLLRHMRGMSEQEKRNLLKKLDFSSKEIPAMLKLSRDFSANFDKINAEIQGGVATMRAVDAGVAKVDANSNELEGARAQGLIDTYTSDEGLKSATAVIQGQISETINNARKLTEDGAGLKVEQSIIGRQSVANIGTEIISILGRIADKVDKADEGITKTGKIKAGFDQFMTELKTMNETFDKIVPKNPNTEAV